MATEQPCRCLLSGNESKSCKIKLVVFLVFALVPSWSGSDEGANPPKITDYAPPPFLNDGVSLL